jgi:hypothetical protein
MGVSRLELVELIEGEVSKLSPRGRDLWERLELHVETEAPEEATPAATLPPPDPEQVEIGRLMGELPLREQGILERLMELLSGLHSSDYAEKRGQPGEPGRDEAVLAAVGIKDHHMGRRIDPDRTPEQAMARLRELG